MSSRHLRDRQNIFQALKELKKIGASFSHNRNTSWETDEECAKKHHTSFLDMLDQPSFVNTRTKLNVDKTFILRQRCHMNVLSTLNLDFVPTGSADNGSGRIIYK